MSQDGAGQIRISIANATQPAVISVAGDIDAHTSPQLRQELADLADTGERLIIIDLRDVTFIDSTGIGVLVGSLKRLRAIEGDLVLRSPTNATRNVLEVTALDEVFTVED